MSAKKRKQSSSSDDDSDEERIPINTPARKRINSSGSGASPGKRRPSSDESSDEDDVADIKSLLPPNLVLQHIRCMKRLIGDKKLHAAAAIKRYCEVAEFDGDKNQLRASISKYLVMSIRPKGLDVGAATDLLTSFLEGGDALKHFPDYPKRPKSLLLKYAQLNGNYNGGMSTLKEASVAIKKDARGKEKAEKEVAKEKVEHLKGLKSFLEKREEELTKTQRSLVHAQIQRLDKTLHPENYPKRTAKAPSSAKRKSVAPKTAYEVFLHIALSDPAYSKYAAMEEEKKNKKLRKKFDKLEENVKDVYEKMALVNSMSS